jgi:hypothetical protein
MGAKAAPLTGDGVSLKIPDGVETAQVLTQAALGTFIPINNRNLSAPELVILFDGGAEQQMQVSGIHIAVGKHLSSCQSRQRPNDAGLPRAPFTA